jgi:hypothetical protein
VAAATVVAHAVGPQRVELVVGLDGGPVVARFALAEGAAVTLRYRNSLYGSLAEERFRVEGARLRLVALAADERAVLDEYYLTNGASPAARTDARRWHGTPREALTLDRLAVAATDLGERTLLVRDHPPLELWRLVEDGRPTVVLEVRRPP